MNILIIEDDLFFAEKIKGIFEKQVISNRVKINYSYEEFILEIPIILSYDIILVDIVLSKITEKNGIDIIKIIREKTKTIPIIIISGLDNLNWLELCFNLGVNDYLFKPFRLKELELRINKWFKIFFYSDLGENNIISYGDLSYHINKNEFYYKDIFISLSKTNKYILSLFISNKEVLLTDQFLIDKIWGDIEYIIERNLRINICRLKKSLDKVGIGNWIVNTRGEGYILSYK